VQPAVQAMSAGDCLIFDDRILHRGLANASEQERWVAYFSYMRPRPGMGGVADTHFEASKSLFG
jgi:ectoine hydroxylase-related dioxygenase (phytanoyl-CoA dioxygenase family)